MDCDLKLKFYCKKYERLYFKIDSKASYIKLKIKSKWMSTFIQHLLFFVNSNKPV